METGKDLMETTNILDIAIIGMSCVFPKAKNVKQFWENLCNEVESIQFFTDEELLGRGVSAEKLKSPDYIKAASVLEDPAAFDAEFFGINPNEAKCMDPQHRIFLECCWGALEEAGYDPFAYEGDIGVFAGLGMNSYIFEVLGKNMDFLKSVSQEQIMIGNDKDFLTTKVSYHLNLKGPSVNVNTACSTSLVSIHLARQSLLLGESDMVLAGGVSISFQNSNGYMYIQDGIQSSDGHCRAFDAGAKGTIWGDGCGVVLLKRLTDAIEDGDHIHAVIKGSAMNNDGSNKVSYTAPSVEGQSKVIVEALTVAGLSPKQINYVEAHGTGTPLGDPIEIAALTEAFRSGTDNKGFCPIGSVKTNIGHLNAAAGIAGLLKTVLALENKKLPASIHFECPNPKIDFENSPFYVNAELTDWKRTAQPLRAGISSMGIGGTNCHVIIEEAPRVSRRKTNDEHPQGGYTLLLSARSSKALEEATDQLAEYLDTHHEISLKDVAYTLQCGRRAFAHRRALRCTSIEEAVKLLRGRDPKFLFDGTFTNVAYTDPSEGSLLSSWLRGNKVNWSAEWRDAAPCRVSLPTYPFERKRFWVEPLLSGEREKADDYFMKVDDRSDWFYLPSWKSLSLPFTAKMGRTKKRMIFADGIGIGRTIARKFEADNDTVVLVTRGERYEQKGEQSFVVNPSDPECYRLLLLALKEEDKLPDSILFGWSLETSDDLDKMDLDSLLSSQQNGYFSILYLTQALAELAVKKPVELIAITNHVYDILGNEELSIHASTIYGMFLVVQQAYDHFVCRVIDISIPESNSLEFEKIIEALENEISHETFELVCAYRGSKRFVRRYEPVRVEMDAPRHQTILKQGTYLVFSGLEGIGFLISEHMVQNIGARLLILEEEDFPEREGWSQWLEDHEEDEPVSLRIRNALQLLEHGAEYIGTISDLDGTSQLLARLGSSIDKINGVIHAPGASNAKRVRSIKSSSPETWKEHFKTVAYSLMILDQIFKNKNLDFRIMLNSLGSVLGGDGFINIATISNYTKAYVTKHSRTDRQSWSVQCWDSWVIEWGQIRNYLPSSVYDRLEPSVLTNQEGIECFEQTFAVKGIIELDISATNLNNRYNKWVKLDPLHRSEFKDIEKSAKHARPDLETVYTAPSNPREHALETIFSELLGIDSIGVHDNFFELGGHSLLGLQLASKIRNLYDIDVNIYYIYNYPTIAGLVTYLENPESSLTS